MAKYGNRPSSGATRTVAVRSAAPGPAKATAAKAMPRKGR